MGDRNPTLSVILTTYNRAELLPRATNSVLSQTFVDFALIIVDDCSQDQSQQVVQTFEDDRIYHIAPMKLSLWTTRTVAMKHATLSPNRLTFATFRSLDRVSVWLATQASDTRGVDSSHSWTTTTNGCLPNSKSKCHISNSFQNPLG